MTSHSHDDEQLADMIARDAARRQTLADQEAGFKLARRNARKDLLCAATVKVKPSSASKPSRVYWKDLENTEEKGRNRVQTYRDDVTGSRDHRRHLRSLCCKPVHPGKTYCREHYLLMVLHVSSRGHASGHNYRPFKAWQVPLRDMSESQEKLLADPERLPLETSYEDCLKALNTLDPSRPLLPIYKPPSKAPRRSR